MAWLTKRQYKSLLSLHRMRGIVLSSNMPRYTQYAPYDRTPKSGITQGIQLGYALVSVRLKTCILLLGVRCFLALRNILDKARNLLKRLDVPLGVALYG